MPTPSAKANYTTIIGVLQVLAGGTLFVFFGIGALISKFFSFLADTSGTVALVLFFISIACGVLFLWRGIKNLIIASNFRKISREMGVNTYIKLSELEKRFNWERNQLVKILRRLINRGFWTEAYIDSVNDAFLLGYTPFSISTDSGNQAVDELLRTANDFIHEMNTICHTITEPALKAQAEHLIDIARQIFTFVKNEPGKIRQVRQFSNYYLPTAVSLLKNYQELKQPAVKGASIHESLQKIEGGMFTIETAFKQQLEDLYRDKSLEISVDIEVLQNMVNNQNSIK